MSHAYFVLDDPIAQAEGKKERAALTAAVACALS